MASSPPTSPKQSITAARMQLASISDEIKDVRKSLVSAQRSVAFDTAAAITEAVRYTRDVAACTRGVPSPFGAAFEAAGGDDVEVQLRRIQVERDDLRGKVGRLQEERDTLLSAQAEMETELRALRAELDVAKLQLRHRDLDLRLQGGKGDPTEGSAPLPHIVITKPDGDTPGTESEARLDSSVQDLSAVLGTSQVLWNAGSAALANQSCQPTLERFSMLHCKGGSPMSKKQAVFGLSALQGQLQVETARRQKLESLLRKDRERLDALFDLADRQKDEIAFLRQRLHDKLAASPPAMFYNGGHGLDSAVPSRAASKLSRRSGGSDQLLQRNASAPTKLPNVLSPPQQHR